MELKDYLRMLRKGWYWFIVTFAATFLVDRFLIQPRVPEYAAEARLLARMGMEPWTAFDLLPPGQRISRPYTNMETKITTLIGRPVFEIGADLLMGKRDYQSDQVPADLRRQIRDEMQRLEQEAAFEGDFRTHLIGALEEAIQEPERERRSQNQFVPIQAIASSANLAIAFANAHAEAAYLYDLAEARETIEKALALNGEMLREERQEQDRLERDRVDFAREQGVYDLQKMEENLQDDIGEIDDELALLETQLKLDRERVRQWLVERTRERVLGVSVFTAGEIESVGLTALTGRLADAQEKVDELLHGFPVHKPGSPELLNAQTRVRTFEGTIREERKRLIENKRNEEDRKMSALMTEIRLREVQLRESLPERRQALEDELSHLATKRLSAEKLDREIELAQESVSSLTRDRKNLVGLEVRMEGPVSFYSAAVEAVSVIEEGEQTVARIFVLVLVAFILGLGIVYFLEYIDTRVITLNDIKRYLDLPLLGVIHKEKGSASLLDLPLDHVIAEKFNTAATLARSAAAERNHKAIMIVSTNEGEGKTTAVVNLGVALARKGQQVILLDADLRRPGLHLLLGVENAYGLTRLVGERADPSRLLEDLAAVEDLASYEIDPYIQPTGVENLSIVPSGPLPENPQQVLESPYAGIAIRALTQKADFVLIDTPPLGAIGDALSLARHVKGTIFVVGAGRLEHHEASWAKSLLSNVQADVLGVLLNFAVQEPRDYYYYYRGERRLRGTSRS